MSRAIFRSVVFGYAKETSVDFLRLTSTGYAEIAQPIPENSLAAIFAREDGTAPLAPLRRTVPPGSIRLIEPCQLGACHVCGHGFLDEATGSWRVTGAMVIVSRGTRNKGLVNYHPVVCSDTCVERAVKQVPALTTGDISFGKLVTNLLVEPSNELWLGEVVGRIRLEDER